MTDQSPLVGLDLGSRSIHLAQLQRRAELFDVVALARTDTPPSAFDETGLADPAALTEALGRLVAEVGCRGRETALALGGPRVLFERLELPATGDLESLALAALADRLPCPPEAVRVVCQELSVGEASRQVAVALAPAALVDGLTGVVEAAGLAPVVLDLTACAQVYALIVGRAGRCETTVVIGDLGASQTTWTRVEASEITVSAALGEGLVEPSDDVSEEVARDRLAAAIELARRVLGEESATNPVAEILLCGGGARSSWLRERLAEGLGRVPTPVDAFAWLTAEARRDLAPWVQADGPAFCAAIGLAVRANLVDD